MKTVIFVETKFGTYFKCDTFWSQSSKPENAKIYSDDLVQLEKWLKPVVSSHVYSDKVEYIIDKYNWSKLGYYTPDESLFENSYRLKTDTKLEDLGDPKYLYIIEMNDFSKWKITEEFKIDDDRINYDLDIETVRSFIDYRVEERDIKINKIIED